MVKKLTITICLCVCFTACNKFDLVGLVAPASADVEKRVAQSLELFASVGHTELTAPTDGYSIYVCSDIHTEEYPYRFTRFLRQLRTDNTAIAGLLLGDIANRKGAIPIAATVADTTATNGNGAPVMAIVGNHDLFFGQWDDFLSHFGPSTYFFTVRTPNHRDLYIMLDSGGGCHGKTQIKWLAEVLSNRKSFRHCIICTHVNLFRTDPSQFMSGNLPLEETYRMMALLSENDVELCLQGHDHHRKETRFEGVSYVTLDCLKDDSDHSSWLLLKVNDKIVWDFINDN